MAGVAALAAALGSTPATATAVRPDLNLVGTRAVYEVSSNYTPVVGSPVQRQARVDSKVTGEQAGVLIVHSVVTAAGRESAVDYSMPIATVQPLIPGTVTLRSGGATFLAVTTSNGGRSLRMGETDGMWFTRMTESFTAPGIPRMEVMVNLMNRVTTAVPASGAALVLLPMLAAPSDGVVALNGSLPATTTATNAALQRAVKSDWLSGVRSSTTASPSCTTGGDSTLQTYDNHTVNIRTSHTKLSLCGEVNASGQFDWFRVEELEQADFINWFVLGGTVNVTSATTTSAHAVGQGDTIGIFPYKVFDEVWKEHNYQEMTLYLQDHSTYLRGHIDVFNTVSHKYSVWRDTTFYTEPNSWPNNQSGPNAAWWILA